MNRPKIVLGSVGPRCTDVIATENLIKFGIQKVVNEELTRLKEKHPELSLDSVHVWLSHGQVSNVEIFQN
jgi:hypothetical protein